MFNFASCGLHRERLLYTGILFITMVFENPTYDVVGTQFHKLSIW